MSENSSGQGPKFSLTTYFSGPEAAGFTSAGNFSGASATLAVDGVDIFTTIGIPAREKSTISNTCKNNPY